LEQLPVPFLRQPNLLGWLHEPEVKVDIDILSKTKYWLCLNSAALPVALSENIPPIQHESIHQI
jgi:hypothetical protein